MNEDRYQRQAQHAIGVQVCLTGARTCLAAAQEHQARTARYIIHLGTVIERTAPHSSHRPINVTEVD